MTVSAFPPAPSRAAPPDVFEGQVDQFLGHLPVFVEEVNQTVTEINGAKETAQTAADTASDKAGQAAGSANTASNEAQLASNAAAAAKDSETSAAGSANTATTKAGAASASATAAAQSALQAQGFAATINPENVNFTGGTLDGVSIGQMTPGPVKATSLTATGQLTTAGVKEDASGNLGLGVTPSAWSSYKAVQVGYGALASTSATNNTLLSSNVYFDGATFRYIGNDYASYMQQFGGGFVWKIAPSGTAGNAISWTQAMTLDSSGNLLVGATTGSNHRISKSVSEGVTVLAIEGLLSGVYISAVSNSSYSGAAAGIYCGKNSTTTRSINAAGTVNASGADYAEYMRKALRHAHWIFQKGDIVGVDVNGELTPVFSDAVAFMVKSTNPSYVGGDVWGCEDVVGKRPEQPVYAEPHYHGSPNPGEMPAAPLLSLPEKPVQQSDESDDIYAIRVASWQEYCAGVQAEFDQVLAAHAESLAAWESAHAVWQADDDKFQAQVIAARAAYESALAQYETDLPAFESRLEEARQRVDRIAFCGQVPVNVTGAVPRQYIVPEEAADGGIVGVAKDEDDLSLRDYMRAVGKVISIESDGRALIVVKVA